MTKIKILITSQVYIAEISRPNLRGALGSSNQLSISFGVTLVYILGAFIEWQWLAVIGAVIPVLLICLMMFMPETPRWLLIHDKPERAAMNLKWLRGTGPHIIKELCEIEVNQQQGYIKFISIILRDLQT